MAMARHRRRSGSDAELRLLLSVREPDAVLYAAELQELAALPGIDVVFTYTRTAPSGWDGLTGRVDGPLLAAAGFGPWPGARVFVCGPTGFVEAVADALLESGHSPGQVKTERFGATGG
jgi:ferredoxin-NADP reductase